MSSSVLAGRRLRYAVAVILHETGRTMSLEELSARVRRGHYRSLGLARSTARWMRMQVEAHPNAAGVGNGRR